MVKIKQQKRTLIQIIVAVLINGYIVGFLQGKIYTGKLKMVCVPGLNCYSCPGAFGACPTGALQAVAAGRHFNFSYYIFGTLMLFGVLFGRLICGFLCPFGLIQDLLHKIPGPKVKVAKKIDRPLRYLKYAVLVIMVILLPAFLTNKFGLASPYFCQLLCPVGTLEGGIPLIWANGSLRSSLGFLFSWKMAILIMIILLSVFIYRPFCKYLCPLGAFYAVFNRLSFYQLTIDKDKCQGCLACEKNCDMGVELTKNINTQECIRCGKCREACPNEAISHSGAKLAKPQKSI